MKSYTTHRGFLFDYSFTGLRLSPGEFSMGFEYVFDVTSSSGVTFSSSIILDNGLLNGWMDHHHRDLSISDRYAIAKMGLFQLLEAVSDPTDVLPSGKILTSMDLSTITTVLSL